MSSDYEQNQIPKFLPATEYITFDIRGSADNLTQFPYKVAQLNSSLNSLIVIPGTKISKDQEFVGELSRIQNWKTVSDFLSVLYEVNSIKARPI